MFIGWYCGPGIVVRPAYAGIYGSDYFELRSGLNEVYDVIGSRLSKN